MQKPDASEVFLIMGQRGEQGKIAIVIAEDARSAVRHFEGGLPGNACRVVAVSGGHRRHV